MSLIRCRIGAAPLLLTREFCTQCCTQRVCYLRPVASSVAGPAVCGASGAVLASSTRAHGELITLSPPLSALSQSQWRGGSACDLYPIQGIYREGNRTRVKAFVLMLRYSGLRIRDVALLSEDKLKGSKLLLYSAKTKVPVYIPLPDFVVKELHKAGELLSGKHFFWSGHGEIKS